MNVNVLKSNDEIKKCPDSFFFIKDIVLTILNLIFFAFILVIYAYFRWILFSQATDTSNLAARKWAYYYYFFNLNVIFTWILLIECSYHTWVSFRIFNSSSFFFIWSSFYLDHDFFCLIYVIGYLREFSRATSVKVLYCILIIKRNIVSSMRNTWLSSFYLKLDRHWISSYSETKYSNEFKESIDQSPYKRSVFMIVIQQIDKYNFDRMNDQMLLH